MGKIINLFVSSRDENDRDKIVSILSRQNNFNMIGIEKDEANTIIKTEKLKPDVVILDFQPPGMNGYELAPIIHRKLPSTFIILLSDKYDENILNLILRTGISGVLLKHTDLNILTPVIEIVNSGGYYFSASILIKILNTVMRRQLSGKIHIRSDTFFSPAERSIVIDIAQGLSDDQIAEHFHFSPGTVKNYVTTIKRKTQSKNRFQIIIYSLDNGLIGFDQVCFKTIDIF